MARLVLYRGPWVSWNFSDARGMCGSFWGLRARRGVRTAPSLRGMASLNTRRPTVTRLCRADWERGAAGRADDLDQMGLRMPSQGVPPIAWCGAVLATGDLFASGQEHVPAGAERVQALAVGGAGT